MEIDFEYVIPDNYNMSTELHLVIEEIVNNELSDQFIFQVKEWHTAFSFGEAFVVKGTGVIYYSPGK